MKAYHVKNCEKPFLSFIRWKLIEQLQLSQTDLAELIGVSKQVVNKIVQGKKAINALELAGIATVLKCTVDDRKFQKKQWLRRMFVFRVFV